MPPVPTSDSELLFWAKEITHVLDDMNIQAEKAATDPKYTVIATIITGTDGIFDTLVVDTNTLVANVSGYTDKVGIGTATPAQTLEVLNAGTQMQLSYDGTNHVTFAVESDGDLTLNSNKASYNLDFTDAILDTSGYINIDDTTNGYQMGGDRILTARGTDNIFVGVSAGDANPSGARNTLVGKQAGSSITGGDSNTCLGMRAGNALQTGDSNVFVGQRAGNTTTGTSNVFIGSSAGGHTTGCFGCIAIGSGAGDGLLTDAQYNTFLGYGCGADITTGDDNIFIGHDVGLDLATENNLFIIDKERRGAGGTGTTATHAIIYGVMATEPENQTLDINVLTLSFGTDTVADPILQFKSSGNTGIITYDQTEDEFDFGSSTGTFGQIIDNGLNIDSGVYTDGDKQLTTAPPTTGTLGFWTRTETPDVLTTATAGDGITTTGLGSFGTLNIGTSGNQLKLSAPGFYKKFEVDSGLFAFQNIATGPTEATVLLIIPVAGREGSLSIDGIKMFGFDASNTYADIIAAGTFDYYYGRTSADGATGEFRVYGFPSGLAKKYGSLQIVDIGGDEVFQISAEDGIFSFATPTANTDIIFNLIGTTNSAQVKWMEDEGDVEIISELVGGDLGLILRNTAAVGSADESVSLIAQTTTTPYPMGKIVFHRAGTYSAVPSRTSSMEFWTAFDATDTLSFSIDFDQNILVDGNNKILLRDITIGMWSQADTFLDFFADGAVRIGNSPVGAPTEYASFVNGTITLVGTGKTIESEKFKLTAIGGYAIRLTNKTGGNTVAGQLLAPYSATAIDNAVKTALTNSDEVFGITLDAGIADGSEMWVVTGGIAAVLMDAGGCARGDRIISSATAGSAAVWNTGGAVATHFQEIGHCFETVAGGALAKVVLHFN